MAIKLGSVNLFGGPKGLGIPLPLGGRLGFGERRAGEPFEGGPKGLIGDYVKVVGRQRGFLILDRGGGKFAFVKTAKRSRGRRSGGGGQASIFNKVLQVALTKALLK